MATPQRELKLPLSIIDIQKCIPHRYPFLLIDRIVELVPGDRVVALKNCSGMDPILQGHFPGMPVLPGVVMVEAAAQAAAVLGHYSLPNGFSDVLLTEIAKARFRRPVVPGDQLRFDIKVARQRAPFFWFEATLSVEGEVAATVQLSALMK